MPSVREFKANLSRFLAEARAGRTLEITSHRKVVARVVGVPDDAEDGLARMVAAGEATWAGGKPGGERIRLSSGGTSVSELVIEDRG